MSKTHPALLTYGKTEDRGFPLILIVGREPNDDAANVSGLGSYSFDDHPRCAYWNSAYGLIGSSLEPATPITEVKRICRNLQSSPIVFAESHPITIPFKQKNKDEIRRAVTDETLEKHVQHVFSFERITTRVELVLFTGVESKSFDRARRAYRALIKHGTPVYDVKFLFGNNMPDIRREISSEGLVKIRDIFTIFRRHGRFLWDDGDLVRVKN